MKTLSYALLSLLARQDFSGYEIKQLMQAPIGFFWRARHSQIYPELARLEELGYVTHEVVEQQNVPDKKVYTLTAAGREQLRQWVSEPSEAAVIRDEFLLKTFSLWLADPAAAIAVVEDQARQHVEQLRVYEGIKQHIETEGAGEFMQPSSAYFASYITLMQGISYEQQYINWCRMIVEQLEALAD